MPATLTGPRVAARRPGTGPDPHVVLADPEKGEEGAVLLRRRLAEDPVQAVAVLLRHSGEIEHLDETVEGQHRGLSLASVAVEVRQDRSLLLTGPAQFLVEVGQPGGEGLREVGVRGLEQVTDQRQGQTHPPEAADPLQAGGVLRPVQPVPGRRAVRRAQEALPVVVQQGAPGEPEPRGQIADQEAVGFTSWRRIFFPVLR